MKRFLLAIIVGMAAGTTIAAFAGGCASLQTPRPDTIIVEHPVPYVQPDYVVRHDYDC